MPAIRITIASNAQQSTKAPLIFPSAAQPDPTSPTSYQSLISKAAQSKLRIKKPTRFYISRDGQELLTEADWRVAVQNDAIILVSAGEEYVGIRKEAGAEGGVNGRGNPECPVEVLAVNSSMDSQAISQLKLTARTLPGIIHAVGQPDLHPGNKFPIGAVFVSQEWIHPPLIGGDIGCGMAWYKTRLSRHQVDGDKGRKVAEKLRGLEGTWRTQEERELWLTESGTCFSAGLEWDAALGTIGAGNHFAEIQVVEHSSADELKEDMVVLLVHSGSRGYGGNILKRYSEDGPISMHEDDSKAQEYLKEHDKACQWARLNRDLIALRSLSCLESDFHMDSAYQGGHLSPDAIKEAKELLATRKVVDIWHNNVQKVSWPPTDPAAISTLEDRTGNLNLKQENAVEPPSSSSKPHAYIHRKGAAPTQNSLDFSPLSILPLPGSRGTPTLILHPIFSAETSWGLKSALSLAHGAGRAMSRAKALASISNKYHGDVKALTVPSSSAASGMANDPKAVKGGTWVVCDEKQLVWEEAEDAYKDVIAVGDDLVKAGAAQVIGWLRPRISYKVRVEER